MSGYVVISPVRNEAEHLPRTIASMATQSLLPDQWIIIDDGSTDSTGSIIDAAAAQYPWIKPVRRPDRGFRQAGGGVIEAFYDGYSKLSTLNPLSSQSVATAGQPSSSPWNFLVKLDGDLSFPPDYFERCFHRFATDPKLGIGGGTICNQVGGAIEVESKVDPAFHVRGATKIYRRECWNQIGGLIRAPGWDTVDEVKANMLGWTTCTFPEIRLIHHRRAGEAYGTWSNLVKNGRANYVAGYHPLFMLAKCLRRSLEKPYLVEGFGLWVGYAGGYLKHVPRVQEPEVIKYFQHQQLNRLFGRKSLWS